MQLGQETPITSNFQELLPMVQITAQIARLDDDLKSTLSASFCRLNSRQDVIVDFEHATGYREGPKSNPVALKTLLKLHETNAIGFCRL